MGFALSAFLEFDSGSETVTSSPDSAAMNDAAVANAEEKSVEDVLWANWYLFVLPILVLPLAMASHVFGDVMQSDKPFFEKLTLAAKEMVGALGMMLSMCTMLLGTLFFFLWSPPFLLAIAMLFLTWAGVLYYVIFVWDGENPPVSYTHLTLPTTSRV